MPRSKSISDEEILALFDEHDAPYMTAKEVADKAGMSRQGMHNRLEDLADNGVLESKNTGRTVGWWIS